MGKNIKSEYSKSFSFPVPSVAAALSYFCLWPASHTHEQPVFPADWPGFPMMQLFPGNNSLEMSLRCP